MRLPWSTVAALFSGSIAIIEGVTCVTQAVSGSHKHTRQRWRYNILDCAIDRYLISVIGR